MAFSNQQIVFLAVFIFGCSTVHGVSSTPSCNATQFEVCTKPAVDAINSTGSLCQGQADQVMECFKGLNCALTTAMKTSKEQLFKSINASASGCAAEEAATTTCSTLQVEACLGHEKHTTDICQLVLMLGPCMPSLLKNCLNATTKATLEAKQVEMEKKKTESKCCDLQEMMTCSKRQVVFANETATEDNCIKLSKAKTCVTELLITCGEPKYVPTLKMKLNTTMTQMEQCESKGYAVVPANSGVSLQPAVALLLSLGFVVMKHLAGNGL